MIGTPIWPNMRVPGPRLKNPSAIPATYNSLMAGLFFTMTSLAPLSSAAPAVVVVASSRTSTSFSIKIAVAVASHHLHRWFQVLALP